MRGGNKYSGYTIIEVLIVLAISSFMFVIASQFISGKAADTSFRTGVNEMASRIQDAIDQVSNGQYTDQQVACSVVGSDLTFTANSGSQGNSQDCIFIGKYFAFTAGDTKYPLYTIAGKTVNDGSYLSANPQIISQFTYKNVIPQGLKPTTSTGFGFAQSLGSYSSGSYSSGAQSLKIVTNDPVVPSVNSLTLTEVVASTYPFICLTDGTRSGKITIGENSSVSVTTKIYVSNNSCN
ncbi:MAG: prepilin-type N-terminal cleavage/methylation domain-containing protein [bacterium]